MDMGILETSSPVSSSQHSLHCFSIEAQDAMLHFQILKLEKQVFHNFVYINILSAKTTVYNICINHMRVSTLIDTFVLVSNCSRNQLRLSPK